MANEKRLIDVNRAMEDDNFYCARGERKDGDE